MSNTEKSFAEEGLGIGWFIVATQANTSYVQNICAAIGVFCIIRSIYYSIKK